MQKVPNASQILLATASLFRSPEWQAVERRRFEKHELRSERQIDASHELLDGLRKALSLSDDEAIWRDSVAQLAHFALTFDTYALHVATYGADVRQILWLIAAEMAPALGRTWGFWCRDEKFMPDLPNGDLWFLPRPDVNDRKRLVLPVEVIAQWWVGLLDGPRESIWANSRSEGDELVDAHRTFQPWVTGRATPEIKSIERLFDDAHDFPYRLDIPAPPTNLTIRRLMLFARAVEQAWKALVVGLTLSPEISPHDPDPMRNKALQLAELFRLAFLFTVAPGTQNTQVADGLFRNALPQWLREGPFWSILPDATGHLPHAQETAVRLSAQFRAMRPGTALPDIFADDRMTSAARAASDLAIATARGQLRATLQVGYDAWGSNTPNRALVVAGALARLRAHQSADQVAADIHHLAALDALSHGEFEQARAHLDSGIKACSRNSYGSVEIMLARLRFGLRVCSSPFDRKQTDADFRIFGRSLSPAEARRWRIGDAPLEYSIRKAAADVADDFWISCRPYPSAKFLHPLSESARMFDDLLHLLLSDADDTAIRAFRKKHSRALKTKLRNVRGDTVLTMMTKMVPDILRTTQRMEAFGSLRGPARLPTSEGITERVRKTFLRLVGKLPVDQLSAQDYLGQTALMLAADRKDNELIELLLSRPIDIDQQDVLGRTALHSAVRSAALGCVDRLLSKGADPSIKTCAGKTALVMAAEFGRATVRGTPDLGWPSPCRQRPAGRGPHSRQPQRGQLRNRARQLSQRRRRARPP